MKPPVLKLNMHGRSLNGTKVAAPPPPLPAPPDPKTLSETLELVLAPSPIRPTNVQLSHPPKKPGMLQRTSPAILLQQAHAVKQVRGGLYHVVQQVRGGYSTWRSRCGGAVARGTAGCSIRRCRCGDGGGCLQCCS